jgi:hypothetical protein
MGLSLDLIVIAGNDGAAAGVPADGDRAIAAGDDGLPGGAGLRQQAGEFLGQGIVFGEEFLQLQAQGGQGIFVVGMGGSVLGGFERSGSGFHLWAQSVPQGFDLLEALFTGLFAEFFGRFLPGKFGAFEQVGQEGGEELHELSRELRVHSASLSAN